MITPNVEELMTYLRGFFIDENVSAVKANQIANALQSQAERIAELERESETHAKAYGLAIVERDNLRHELKTAQDVTELVEALERVLNCCDIAECGTVPNSPGALKNARTALSKYKGAK